MCRVPQPSDENRSVLGSSGDAVRLRLKFLGVRGSYPTPAANRLRFGGHTTCLEVSSRSGNRLYVDAGSGITDATLPPGDGGHHHVLITHFHSDHTQGLPFFEPMFRSGSRVTFYTGEEPETARRLLEAPMASPYFPALDFMVARREYAQIDVDTPFTCGDISVQPFRLNHPQGAWGYRLECEGASIVHASDHEHGDPAIDAVLREHAQNADVLIYDAQYTDAEYASKAGWGHSTWREATRLARDARVGRLILFHHDPNHDDETMQAIEAEAQQHFDATEAARQSSLLTVSS
jgi:phosphoribosyl 1,2-cyclic phosphodiesterase